jgi:hypothetical protein
MLESTKQTDAIHTKYINDITEEIIEPLMLKLAKDKPESYNKVFITRKNIFEALSKIMILISAKQTTIKKIKRFPLVSLKDISRERKAFVIRTTQSFFNMQMTST